MPDVFDTLTESSTGQDIFDLVGNDSPTPETDKALAQLPSELSAPPPESVYDPNKYPIAERAAQSVVGYVKGMIPTSVNQALRMANVPTNWQDPEQLTTFLAPALKMPFDTVHQIVSRAKQIQEADKTPPFSQERWDAAVGTGLDVLGTAAMLKGGMRPEAPVARPEGEPAPTTPRGVEPAPAATTEATGAVPEQPLTQAGGEVTDAQQISSPAPVHGDVLDAGRAQESGGEMSAPESGGGVPARGQGEIVGEPPPQEDVVTQSVKRIVNQANTHPRELRIAIDNKTGKILAENVGTQLPKEWDKPSEEAGWGPNDEAWRKVGGAEDITDMHSHPEPIGPSDGDWGVFGFSNVRKMIVAEKGGKVWTIEKTPKWDAMDWQERTPRKLRDAYNAFVDAIQGPELSSRTVEEHIAHVNRLMADKFGVKLTESVVKEPVAVTQPEGGERPATAAVSGAETPPAAEPQMGGVSAKAFERIYGEGEIPGGEGKSPEEMFSDAKARQAAGKSDPYAVVQRARTGAITPEEFSDLVAEHDRLVNEAAAREGTPEYEPAYQAARDFATNVIGPAKTRVSDTMRAMQIKAPIDYTRLTGFRQALQERLGREMTPEEAPAFQKVASDVAKANVEAQTAAQQTATRVQRHFSRVKDITFEDAVRQLQEDISKALTDCNL